MAFRRLKWKCMEHFLGTGFERLEGWSGVSSNKFGNPWPRLRSNDKVIGRYLHVTCWWVHLWFSKHNSLNTIFNRDLYLHLVENPVSKIRTQNHKSFIIDHPIGYLRHSTTSLSHISRSISPSLSFGREYCRYHGNIDQCRDEDWRCRRCYGHVIGGIHHGRLWNPL